MGENHSYIIYKQKMVSLIKIKLTSLLMWLYRFLNLELFKPYKETKELEFLEVCSK